MCHDNGVAWRYAPAAPLDVGDLNPMSADFVLKILAAQVLQQPSGRRRPRSPVWYVRRSSCTSARNAAGC